LRRNQPIPVKGRQGLWNIDPAVLGEIQSQTVNAELFNVKHPLEPEQRSQPTANINPAIKKATKKEQNR